MQKNIAPETEKSLLGGLLINSDQIIKYMNYLSADLFFNEKNKIVFNNLEFIASKKSDLKIEVAYLIDLLNKETTSFKVDWHHYIIELFEHGCDERNIISLAQELDNLFQLRELEKAAFSITKEVQNANKKSTSEIINIVEQKIFDATRNRKVNDFESVEKISKKTYKNILKKVNDKETSGITSGLFNLDKLTNGFQKSDLIILAARPSMGKTALALNIAVSAAKKNNVAFVSLEMSSEQLMTRILGTASLINYSTLKKPGYMSAKDWVKLESGKSKVEKLGLHIDDTPGLLLGELIWKVRKLNRIKKLDMLVIDYLQLITLKSNYNNENRQMEVSTISRNLKFLAKELDIPILALSQLSRKVEQRENKRPMMSDIRESGAIEQDADIILFLYREEYYKKPEDHDENNYSDVNEAELIIAKHRNGPTGTANLIFKPSFGLFNDLKKEDN